LIGRAASPRFLNCSSPIDIGEEPAAGNLASKKFGNIRPETHLSKINFQKKGGQLAALAK
jgi:hypothetical protein